MIPKQEYELVNVCRQTMEEGTPLICDDCGRVIFNIATIKGKMDGKTYNVGLTCVKKLLNKTIYFNNETMWEYERQVAEWNEAFNTRKWMEKSNKKRVKEGKETYLFVLKRYINDEGIDRIVFELRYQNGNYAGSTKSMDEKYLPVFAGMY